MKDRLGITLFAAVVAGFLAAGVLFVLFGAPQRFVGAALVAVGAFAILAARGVADGARKSIRVTSLGTRRESSLRPTTIILWDAGVAVIGVLLIAGL